MPFSASPTEFENDKFRIYEDSNGDLIKEHKSTGATFKYDSTDQQWVASDGLQTPALEANDLINAPLLLGQKNRFITERIDSLEDVQQVTNGSGAINDLAGALELSTGTTADSFASIFMENFAALNQFDFGSDQILRFDLEFSTVASDADDQVYAVVTDDNELSEDTYTKAHIGVGAKDGDLVATSGNGSNQGTTVIQSGISGAFRTVWILWDADNSEADYYVNNPPQSASSDATHNTNVPGGSNGSSSINIVADNGSAGNDNVIRISEYVHGVE